MAKINYYIRSRNAEHEHYNKDAWSYINYNNFESFSFGLLLHVNDYEWHHGYGQGKLEKVFETYEEAKNHEHVYDCYEGNDCWSDIAIEVKVEKAEEKDYVYISVSDTITYVIPQSDIADMILLPGDTIKDSPEYRELCITYGERQITKAYIRKEIRSKQFFIDSYHDDIKNFGKKHNTDVYKLYEQYQNDMLNKKRKIKQPEILIT